MRLGKDKRRQNGPHILGVVSKPSDRRFGTWKRTAMKQSFQSLFSVKGRDGAVQNKWL